MRSLRTGLLLCILCASAYGAKVDFGEAHNPSLQVAVSELLARAEFFDGQPVRIIGVAVFDFGFEGQSAVYSSRDDASLRTFNGVSIKSFSSALKETQASWAAFSGRFVLVEGTFHAVPRTKVGPNKSICFGSCLEPGYLDNVHRVRLWEGPHED